MLRKRSKDSTFTSHWLTTTEIEAWGDTGDDKNQNELYQGNSFFEVRHNYTYEFLMWPRLHMEMILTHVLIYVMSLCTEESTRPASLTQQHSRVSMYSYIRISFLLSTLCWRLFPSNLLKSRCSEIRICWNISDPLRCSITVYPLLCVVMNCWALEKIRAIEYLTASMLIRLTWRINNNRPDGVD